MKKDNNTIELQEKNIEIITLWHGGYDLDKNYQNGYQGAKKDRWRMGPGLYLTNSYEYAKKYAAGSKSMFRVEVEKGNNLSDIDLSVSEMNQFIIENFIQKKQKEVLDYLYKVKERRGGGNSLNADVLVNLALNFEAISSRKVVDLNKFLVNKGADYFTQNNVFHNSSVLVLMNFDKIKKVEKVPAKNISVDDYDLPFEFVKTEQAKSKVFRP